MITASGENVIGRAVSNYLASHIAVGVANTAPTLNDKELGFEVYRGAILVRSYDATTNILTLKTTIPEHLDIFINEVALISSTSQGASAGILTKFDQGLEEWVGGTFTTSNVRVGGTGLTVALATASTAASTRVALSETKQSDVLQVAFFGAGGTVEVRLTNSSTDYFSFTFPATAGYNVIAVPLSTLTATGTPDINSVNGITVVHSGTGSVTMDAIRVSSVNPEDGLVVRQIIGTPYRKVAGMPLDIEIPVEITLA